MGKRAKKKIQAPTRENQTMTVSKKVSEQPSQAEEVAEPAVITVKEKQTCVHLEKGLNLDKLLDKIKSSKQIKCEECREGVHGKRGTKAKGNKGKKDSCDPKSDKKAIWVCLECGCYVCGGVGLPTGAQSHVVRHIRLTRHRLVIQWENPQLRWCFPCNSLLPFEKDEKDVLFEVVKSMKGRSLSTLALSDTQEQSFGSGSITSDIKSGDVTSGLDAKDGYVVRGLVNLGNTCFFNSIMQNLLSLDQLRRHFLKEDVSGFNGPLASSLKKLFTETKPESGLKSVINPRVFFGSFCTKAPQFRGYDQHDSHELLRCLLDSLSTEESALRKKKLGVSDNDEKSTLIDYVFGGETSSIVSCMECGHSSKVYEPFLDLSLPVPFKKTPLKKQQTVSRPKKVKLPPKKASKNVSKVSKVSPTKALSELNSPGKADSDTSSSIVTPIENGPVLESPVVIPQSDSVFDSFWLDIIGPETTNLDNVSDKVPTFEANLVVPGPNLPDNTSISSERLMQENSEFAEAKTEKDKQSDDCRDVSCVSEEVNQANCINGDSGFGESSSSVNPWEEEELPMVVADSQILYLPYKEGEDEASSSFITGDFESQSNDFVDFGGLFDEPEEPVFGPPSGVGLMAFSSESDPEEIDDSESPVSIERCLAHFTKPEILSDDNAWNCENCSKNLKRKSKNDESRSRSNSNGVFAETDNGEEGTSCSESEEKCLVKRDARKRVVINKTPLVLTIHLKRFSQDLRGRLSKLNGHVAFNEFIDLRQFMDSRCTGEIPPVYRLVGLVEHSGTMRGGHYVAYVRGAHRVKETDSSTVWYNVSDAHVSQVSLEKVLLSEAYILFYEKIISQN